MSMTKRYLESLPEDEQNAILGEVDADYEAWWSQTSKILGLSPEDVYADDGEPDEWPDDDVYRGEGDLEC